MPSRESAKAVMGELIDGKLSDAQAEAFLLELKGREPDVLEIVGFAEAMRERATPVRVGRADIIDTCGTGGDGSSSFNISTAAAIIAAGAGAFVAKHGNRAVSSRCGSADVLEALGVKTAITPALAARCVEEAGVGFLFAPSLHPGLKKLAPLRKKIGRTVFNLLGPLANPAGAKRQVIGVYARSLVPLVAAALKELGSVEAIVVASHDGLDEISLGAKTAVAHLK
jgi:anthranilate phosphoribosyltransferase